MAIRRAGITAVARGRAAGLGGAFLPVVIAAVVLTSLVLVRG